MADEPVPAPTPYPGLQIALPVESGITVRWACPPMTKEQAGKGYLYDVQLSIDTDGAPWLGLKGRNVLCPRKSLLFDTPRPYTGFTFLDNGALLVATKSDWGYLVPPEKTSAPGKRPPVAAYQPVATLPSPEARLFPGVGGPFFAGKNAATGKYDVHVLLLGTNEDLRGPAAYMHVFSADEPITAVAGGLFRAYIAVGDVVLVINPLDKTLVATHRFDGAVQALACDNDVLYFATPETVGVLTEHGRFDLLRATNPRIAAHGDSLYVALPDTLGVLALDRTASLAQYDLNVPAVPAGVSPTVKLTDVRCFAAGEQAPPPDERQFTTTLTRAPGRFLYVQAELENLRPDRTHTERVKIVAARENGGLYFHDTVTFTFEKDAPSLWGWVRFGTADYPPYPGDYTITTYLNGAKADTRVITVDGTVSAAQAAGNFDLVRLEAALKRGESANTRVDGTPLLISAARGYHWIGSTPEERQRRIVGTVRLLLKYGADVKARDAGGETALHKATGAWLENAEVITLLLKAGADVNARDNSGETPLHEAMLMGSPAKVKALLVKGIDPNVRDHYERTALHKAVEHGHLPVVQALLAKGTNPALVDKYGVSALFAAAAKQPEMLRAMLKAGANPNATAMIYNVKRSLLGHVLNEVRFTRPDPERMAQLRASAALLVAHGADLLPDEIDLVFISHAYQLLDQASLERAFARDTEMGFDGKTKTSLLMSASIDDPIVQRAAINYLLGQSRVLLAKATSVVQYQQALEHCNTARARMEKYLHPRSTWPPEVLYNCALLEAHLGEYARAQEDLTRYLELAPAAKDAKAIHAKIKEYGQRDAALRAPITPADLVGIWWPDGETPDREKFFRLEFAVHGGVLYARTLAQQEWETTFQIGAWVPVKITGNQIEIDDASFRTSTSDEHGNYETDFDLQRIGENRLLGEVYFSGKRLKDGKIVGNSGRNIFEWRRRK
ncbi:MAG: ankyrin repeat domain-containing protein [Armatimonadota bacterium]